MSDRATQRVEVSVGDVHSSQLVIGDHNTIQTPEGTEVTVLQVGDRPVPRLRPLPVSRRPNGGAIFGRRKELALIAAASPADALQLYGDDGVGKTCLLKFAAAGAPASAEGVVFESVRHRSLDEIQAALYRAFWQCDIPFVPAPAQMPDFLADREALLILDDCGLDRSEVEILLDGLPCCTVVLAAAARTLWSQGTAHRLEDLDSAAAAELLERELGRALDPEERATAELVVSRLGGKPQTLVEAAALIADERASLRELAEDPEALERRLDSSALTEPQKRILAILSTLHGAALGTERVAELTANPELEESLQALERRGWVKAGSPRYRSVRRLRLDGGKPPEEKLAKSLLEVLTAWGRKASPDAVADEAEAIERSLEFGTFAGWWKETLALTLAVERGLAVAGAWASCRRVLQLGLEAADALGDESARAFLIHQLGSQALCLGENAEAEAQLSEALRIREKLGEHEGADLTRHNLAQMEGGGADGPDGGGGGGPRLPRIALILGAAAVVAGVLVALALNGGTGRNTANTSPTGRTHSTSTTSTESSTETGPTTTLPTTTTTTTTPPSGSPPTIAISSPEEGATLPAGERAVTASFDCTEAEGTHLTACHGVVDGVKIESGDALPMGPGTHTLTVTAVDADGLESTKTSSYEVKSAPPPPPPHSDETAPVISVSSPEGAYEQGAQVKAEYSCSDAESEPTSCEGEVANEAFVETKALGTHSFAITAVDAAENVETRIVEYTVIPRETLK